MIPNILQSVVFEWFEKTQWPPSEGATCAWMAADEAFRCTRAFLMIWWYSRRLVCRGLPEPGLCVNDISRIDWSQQCFTTHRTFSLTSYLPSSPPSFPHAEDSPLHKMRQLLILFSKTA
ncbi:uncharacterized protein TNCV_781661 [Trichonephila clavipes]|nr:uncharacterized protein TNCV_781661 [Trichonephila clavipes]